jgi:hypothetical protein
MGGSGRGGGEYGIEDLEYRRVGSTSSASDSDEPLHRSQSQSGYSTTYVPSTLIASWGLDRLIPGDRGNIITQSLIDKNQTTEIKNI